MKIGIDIDGTAFAFPEFFSEFIPAMVDRGHEFFCTSSHARSEWDADSVRLESLGIDPAMISPEMLYDERHGDVSKKAQQADQLDIVFDDDGRIQQYTQTPIVCMPNMKEQGYSFQRFT